MVDLLAEHLNICSNSITNILQNNNIRINQRLLLDKEIIMNKPEIKKTKNIRTNNSTEEVETKFKETKDK